MIQNDNDKVWVTISRTISTGNYESVKVEASISRTITAKDEDTELLSDLCDEVFEVVQDRSKEYTHVIKRKPRREPPVYDNTDND
jgi:ribosomal protein L17